MTEEGKVWNWGAKLFGDLKGVPDFLSLLVQKKMRDLGLGMAISANASLASLVALTH